MGAFASAFAARNSNSLPAADSDKKNKQDDEDDDVIICEDSVSEIVREDYHKALQPTNSRLNVPPMVKSVPIEEKQIPKSSIGVKCSSSKIVIENVRSVSRRQFGSSTNPQPAAAAATTTATTTMPASTRPRRDGMLSDDSDSDLEILEERIVSTGNLGTRRVENNGNVNAKNEQPAPAAAQPEVAIKTTVFDRAQAMSRLLFKSDQSSLPPTQLMAPPTQPMAPPTAPSTRFPAPQLPTYQPHHRPIVNRPRQSGVVVRPVSQQSSTKVSMVTMATMAPVGGQKVTPRLDLLRPSLPRAPVVPDATPLPVFGQNYGNAYTTGASRDTVSTTSKTVVGQNPNTKPAPAQNPNSKPAPAQNQASNSKPVAAQNRTRTTRQFQQAPKGKKRRRVESTSSEDSTSISNSSNSNGVDEAIGGKKKRENGPVVPTDKNKQVAKTVLEFPRDYYGRLRPTTVVNKRKKNDDNEFDGLFLCNICNQICVSNIAYVNHVYAHVLHRTIEDESLKDQTGCGECWRVFDYPYQQAKHYEEVHRNGDAAINFSVCYICELSFADDSTLQGHMRDCHTYGRDMPYSCKTCRYRSSLYADVWNHFLLEHKNTLSLMCPICLTSIDAKINAYDDNLTTANADTFMVHIWRHIEIGSQFACSQCKLQFVSLTDLNSHRKYFHRQWQRGDNGAFSKQGGNVTELTWRDARPLTEMESTGQQLVGRRLVHESAKPAPLTIDDADCIECHQSMANRGHYSRRSVACGHCPFSTHCLTSITRHRIFMHKKSVSSACFEYKHRRPYLEVIPNEIGYCTCGFESRFGIKLSNHAVSCPGGQIRVRPVDSPKERSRCRLSPSKLLVLKASKILLKAQHRREDEGKTDKVRSPRTMVAAKSEKEEFSPSPSTPTPTPTIIKIQGGESINSTPYRPRLLSPQMSTKRSISTQSSVVDDELPPTLAQKRIKKAQSKSRNSAPKLGPVFVKRYQQWNIKHEAISSMYDRTSDELCCIIGSLGTVRKTAANLYDFWLQELGGTADDVTKEIGCRKKAK